MKSLLITDMMIVILDGLIIHYTVIYVSSYTPNGVGATSGTSLTSGELCVARGSEERSPAIMANSWNQIFS